MSTGSRPSRDDAFSNLTVSQRATLNRVVSKSVDAQELTVAGRPISLEALEDLAGITPFVAGTDAGAPYQSIQEAVNAAQASGVSNPLVLVRPGTYVEDVAVTQALTIWGVGNPVLQGTLSVTDVDETFASVVVAHMVFDTPAGGAYSVSVTNVYFFTMYGARERYNTDPRPDVNQGLYLENVVTWTLERVRVERDTNKRGITLRYSNIGLSFGGISNSQIIGFEGAEGAPFLFCKACILRGVVSSVGNFTLFMRQGDLGAYPITCDGDVSSLSCEGTSIVPSVEQGSGASGDAYNLLIISLLNCYLNGGFMPNSTRLLGPTNAPPAAARTFTVSNCVCVNVSAWFPSDSTPGFVSFTNSSISGSALTPFSAAFPRVDLGVNTTTPFAGMEMINCQVSIRRTTEQTIPYFGLFSLGSGDSGAFPEVRIESCTLEFPDCEADSEYVLGVNQVRLRISNTTINVPLFLRAGLNAQAVISVFDDGAENPSDPMLTNVTFNTSPTDPPFYLRSLSANDVTLTIGNVLTRGAGVSEQGAGSVTAVSYETALPTP